MKKYIVISCGADSMAGGVLQTKVWPKEYWERLVVLLGGTVVQLGSTSDFVVKGAVNMLGKTSLPEAAYIISKSQYCVFSDCGLMHVAKALGKRSVVMWGPTDYKIFGYKENVNIVAKNHGCFLDEKYWPCKCKLETRKCMESITPEFVVKTIQGNGL